MSIQSILVTEQDYALRLISLDDDPTLPVFTFRMVFLGLGLSCFAAVLGQLFVSSLLRYMYAVKNKHLTHTLAVLPSANRLCQSTVHPNFGLHPRIILGESHSWAERQCPDVRHPLLALHESRYIQYVNTHTRLNCHCTYKRHLPLKFIRYQGACCYHNHGSDGV